MMPCGPPCIDYDALSTGAGHEKVRHALRQGFSSSILVRLPPPLLHILREDRAQTLAATRALARADNSTQREQLRSCRMTCDVPLRKGVSDTRNATFTATTSLSWRAGVRPTDASWVSEAVADAPALGALPRLSRLLTHVAALVARALDARLEESVVAAGTCKVRAIHYFAGHHTRWWSRPHFDYGLLTALTAPAYWGDGAEDALQDGAEARAECEGGAGLRALQMGADAPSAPPPSDVPLPIPVDCILVQTGEAAQILSGGHVSAGLHGVARPVDECHGLTERTTLAVFLQPPWTQEMSPWGEEETEVVLAASPPVGSLAPPLAVRWVRGQTFAEFSKSTTAAYYGTGRAGGATVSPTPSVAAREGARLAAA